MLLPEPELERLRALVASRLPAGDSPAATRPEWSPLLDQLVGRSLDRYPPLLEAEDARLAAATEDGPAPPLTLDAVEGGQEGAAEFVAEQLEQAFASPYFPLVEEVARTGSSGAFERLMEQLDRELRLRGILYRHRLDPEAEYGAIWGKVWESIGKWDGRDFRAYVARIVRNYCLDEVARRKKAPGGMESDPGDVRPRGQTARTAGSRDAIQFLCGVLEDLEASGRIKALDGVIFAQMSQGRAVADIVHAFRVADVIPRFVAAFRGLGLSPKQRAAPGQAVALRSLVDGLAPDEVAPLTGLPVDRVEAAAAALGRFEDEDELLLARALARPGLNVSELERARRFTTNAVNLVINRLRLKVWMALLERASDALRRRGVLERVELAVIEHRCRVEPPTGCRMYKDRTCKYGRDPEEIARLGGLDVSGAVVARRMDDLRARLLEEGLGMVFPDYNACLNERKSAGPSPSAEGPAGGDEGAR